MIPTIQRLLGPVHRRVMLMVNRCVLNAINDGLGVQGVQITVLQGEVRDDAERFQEYGFTSVPHGGAEGVVVSVGGNHDHGIVIAVEDKRYRLTGLQSGEVALYDDLGQKVHLTRSGIRVEGQTIALHAKNSFSWDVNGFGERWTSLGGGVYEHHTWQQGATVNQVVTSFNPPEGP